MSICIGLQVGLIHFRNFQLSWLVVWILGFFLVCFSGFVLVFFLETQEIIQEGETNLA